MQREESHSLLPSGDGSKPTISMRHTAWPYATTFCYCIVMMINGGLCGAFGPSLEVLGRKTHLTQAVLGGAVMQNRLAKLAGTVAWGIYAARAEVQMPGAPLAVQPHVLIGVGLLVTAASCALLGHTRSGSMLQAMMLASGFIYGVTDSAVNLLIMCRSCRPPPASMPPAGAPGVPALSDDISVLGTHLPTPAHSPRSGARWRRHPPPAPTAAVSPPTPRRPPDRPLASSPMPGEMSALLTTFYRPTTDDRRHRPVPDARPVPDSGDARRLTRLLLPLCRAHTASARPNPLPTTDQVGLAARRSAAARLRRHIKCNVYHRCLCHPDARRHGDAFPEGVGLARLLCDIGNSSLSCRHAAVGTVPVGAARRRPRGLVPTRCRCVWASSADVP